MFEDSPRANKRRRIGDGNGQELLGTPARSTRTRSATPGIQSRKQTPMVNGRNGVDNGLAEGLLEGNTVPGFTDSAYQSLGNGEVEEQAQDLSLDFSNTGGDTGPGMGIGRGTSEISFSRSEQQVRESRESSTHDTIEVPQPESNRTSARQRKKTWKLAPPTPEIKTPKRAKRTPASAKRVAKQPVKDFTPVAKDAVREEEPSTTPAALAAAALNVVTDVTVTPTPTPKKRGRPPKVAQVNGDTPTPTPKKRGRPPKAPAQPVPSLLQDQPPATVTDGPLPVPQLADDDIVLDSSPFKTQPLTLTPTPRKRGRPPKAKVVDEFGFLAADPLGAASKKPRTSLAQDSEDVDPLAVFVRRDPAAIAAKTALKRKAEPAKAKALTWEDFKDKEAGPQAKPDISSSLARLQGLLEDDIYVEPLKYLRAGIIQALTGKRRMPLLGLDEEYRKVRQMVEHTIVAGEGNSMMVIGPRGCGKSTLLEMAINEMTIEHPEEFHVIRLNGFIHTDDKLALREIWRQLGREMELEDENMLERNNYADALSSLLAVLSHDPADQGKRQQEGELEGQGDAEHKISRSVIFVIDEFDLFTTHARQTLLYNLFDIAQARKAPIAVLGLTTRVDVTESLEKRVKSRFSHRSIFLPRPKSFLAFQQICLAALKASTVSSVPLITASPEEEAKAELYRTLHAAWSDYITSLFHDSTAITAVLRNIYATSRSVPTALTTFLLPIATFTPTNIPQDSTFASQTLLPPDSKSNLLRSLNDLELALLIAAARLDIILNVDTCNFNMAYDEYTQLASRTRVQNSASGAGAQGSGAGRLWSREAALGAWERLEILELIMPLATAGYGASAGLADVGRAGKLMRCDVSMEEIRYSGVELSTVMMKWCKEI